VTILKSVPSHPWIIDPTPEVAPRVRKNERGASLYIFDFRFVIFDRDLVTFGQLPA